ncbi:hypothetical protein [Christiangramia salexigens]|uniref:Glycerophosphoryl diester phosphodiesterase membrane domain-containing protein n=1 Tax=Christiangramia salexigens TaxID=1913577 RepID=A0A1L3J3S8_9FLAO|nr:hypothetical protein [Christiangramia salexigens]APG59781.1 hypothetical protein LPB144_04835 [Christiangramia salexigens]
MTQEPIQFKKQRELGEILNSTFKFLRENYKEVFKIFIKLLSPAFIILVGAAAYYSWISSGSMSIFGAEGSSSFIIAMAVLFVAYWFYITAMTGTVYHIILSYVTNSGKIRHEDVKHGIRRDFAKLLILTLISWIMIFAGTLFFIIPGIFLMVPLSLSAAIMVFQRKGISESISDSFYLIKENWWMTFASILCIGLIVYMISLVFQIPTIIYYVIKIMTSASQGSAANPSELLGTGYIVINTISTMIQYLVYAITPIAMALVYFNLNEKKHFTGTYETIENLGKNT